MHILDSVISEMSRYIAFLVILVVYLLGSISATCPPNEVFRSCGTDCEPTCKVPHPRICDDLCLVDVCQCSPGYVRNSAKQCVKLSECS